MASEIQDLGERMYRVGCLQGKLEIFNARLKAMGYKLKQMEKDRDDIRQELEDTLGAFKNRTIQEVLDSENPGYLLWLVDATDIDLSSDILDEADGLASDNPVDWWNVK